MSLTAQAQVVINEFSAANLNQFTDNYNKYEDWIELYNTSSTTVNLAGWFLSDNETNPTKWPFPANATLGPNGYLRVWCDGRNEFSGGQHHTNFKLKQTFATEEVVLSGPNGVVDNIPLGLTQVGHSFCRSVNGAGTWMITTNPTPGASNTSSPMYTGYAEKPQVNIEGGFYPSGVVIALANAPANATVRFTTNGNLPTTASPVFNGTGINSTSVLKLRAFSNDPLVLPSLVEFNTYLINESFTLPVFSVAADQLIQLANGNGSLEPVGSLEYFNAQGQRTAMGYGELNRHGQDSWVNFQRSLDWITRDEMGYADAIHENLYHQTDRDEFQRVMFRASGDDNYPADNVPPSPNNVHDGGCHVRDEYAQTLAQKGGMKLDIRSVERVILFLNGQYWGVYAIRERPDDHDYIEHNYGHDKYQIQYLETWGWTWAEYGGDQAFTDWATTRDLALNQNMGNQANYDQLKDQLNVTSLIDYMTINLMVVASDWLNYNTGWWRGLNPEGDHKKWGYNLWDLDATFDYYINYSGVPNTTPYALPCDIAEIGSFIDNWFEGQDVGKHEQIFLKLLSESTEFQQLYYSRYADHVNTTFSCDRMIAIFDSMVNIITPEMPRHINRWGGSMSEWNGNVQEMRAFIQARCGIAAQNLVTCYPVTGPHNLTLKVEPAGAGSIKLNTLTHAQFPWTGQYYGSMDNLIEAIPANPLYVFQYWQRSSGGAISPSATAINGSLQLSTADTLTAVFLNTTGIENPLSDALFRVYPNPAHGAVFTEVVLPNGLTGTLSLFTPHGQKVFSQGMRTSTARFEIPLEGLATGLYLVVLDTDKGKLQQRLSVVR